MERVFELNRVFRNEGADSIHSPEFTMLELYQAYTGYAGMAELTRTLYQTVARDVFGSTTLRLADGSEYDVGGEWAQISLFGAVSEALGEEISPAIRSAQLVRHAERVGLEARPVMTRRCRSTRTSWAPWSTECRRAVAWEWGSTGCSWRSPVRVSVRSSCFRWYGHNEWTGRRGDFPIRPEMR